MPKFSGSSLEKLQTCDSRLQTLFNKVIEFFDCKILCGFRGKEEQNLAFEEGTSKKKWPDGEHNKMPSKAVDAIPWPIDWGDTNRMRYFAGIVMGIARMMDIPLRWGGDWNQNTILSDQTFNDLVHFELI